MEPNAVIELERLANSITEHDLRMMISHGGANSVYEFIQLTIEMRVNYLKHQQEAAA